MVLYKSSSLIQRVTSNPFSPSIVDSVVPQLPAPRTQIFSISILLERFRGIFFLPRIYPLHPHPYNLRIGIALFQSGGYMRQGLAKLSALKRQATLQRQWNSTRSWKRAIPIRRL